jgi:hypothetical protein
MDLLNSPYSLLGVPLCHAWPIAKSYCFPLVVLGASRKWPRTWWNTSCIQWERYRRIVCSWVLSSHAVYHGSMWVDLLPEALVPLQLGSVTILSFFHSVVAHSFNRGCHGQYYGIFDCVWFKSNSKSTTLPPDHLVMMYARIKIQSC